MTELIDYTVKTDGIDFVIEDGEGRNHHVNKWGFHPYEFFRVAATTSMREGVSARLKIDAPTRVVQLMLNMMWNQTALSEMIYENLHDTDENFVKFAVLSHQYLLPISALVHQWGSDKFEFEFWVSLPTDFHNQASLDYIVTHEKFVDWLASGANDDNIDIWIFMRGNAWSPGDVPKLYRVGQKVADKYADKSPIVYERIIRMVLERIFAITPGKFTDQPVDLHTQIESFIDKVKDPAERDHLRRMYTCRLRTGK